MRRFILSSLTLLISLVFLVPLSATAQTPGNYVTLKAGVYTPTGDLDDAEFDSGFNGEVVFGHYFSPNFALEGGLGYFHSKSSVSGFDPDPIILNFSEDDDISVVPITITAKGVIPVGQSVELYGGAGVGAYYARAETDVFIEGSGVNDSDEDSDTVFGFHALAGANFNIWRNVFFGIEGKYIWTDDAEFSFTVPSSIGPIPVDVKTNLNGYMVTGNLGFRF